MKKKIYINGKFFTQPITGTQRYARELLNQIDIFLSDDQYKDLAFEVLIPVSANVVPRYSNLRVQRVGKMHGTVWEQLELPKHCRGHILVTFSGGAPILHSRNVIAIHDAAVFAAPAGYSTAYRIWYRWLYRRMARTAEHILTVSEFSKSEIVRWCGTPVDKITVTQSGSDHFSAVREDPSALSRLGISGSYVLAVSSHNPNKNFDRVAQALASLKKKGFEVIIAGGHNRRVYRKESKPPSGVRILGYVSDSELKTLYQHAACFVFASLYEGFGLPPLEAISTGCPIVLSRAASLPEIYDGAAVFCDPYSPEDIARAVEQALDNPPASPNELRVFAGKYSWELCARKALRAIASL